MSSGGVDSLRFKSDRTQKFLGQKRDYRLLVDFPESPLPAPRNTLTLEEQHQQVPFFLGKFERRGRRSSDELREDIRFGESIGWFQPEVPGVKPVVVLREEAKRDIALWKYNHRLRGSRKVDDADDEDRFVTVNGQKTRKRRADTTQDELLASLHGIYSRANTQFTIERFGVTTNDIADKFIDVHSEVMRMNLKEACAKIFPILKHRWFPAPLLLIMADFHSVYSYVGELLGSLIGVYRIAEVHEKTDRGHSNKRFKISLAEPEPARWIDPWTHGKLQDEAYAFYKFICIIARGLDTYHDNPGIDYILKPLRSLVGKSTHKVYSDLYKGAPHMAMWLSGALAKTWRVFDAIYDPQTLSSLRPFKGDPDNTFRYEFTESRMGDIRDVQRLLLNPRFNEVMMNLADALCAHDPNMKHLPFPKQFIARGIMDMEAVIQGVPAPSYIRSDDYETNFLKLYGGNIGRALPTEETVEEVEETAVAEVEEPPKEQNFDFPGAFPTTPPRTPSPAPRVEQRKPRITDSSRDDPVLQSPPSPSAQKSFTEVHEETDEERALYDGPVLADDGYRYPNVKAYNYRYQHPSRDTAANRAIKKQYIVDFSHRTPPRGSARIAKPGTGALRRPRSPTAIPSTHVRRRVHFGEDVHSPAPRKNGIAFLFSTERFQRVDDENPSARSTNPSAEQPQKQPATPANKKDSKNTQTRSSATDELNSEHIHFSLWEQPLPETKIVHTIEDPRSPACRSPTTAETKRYHDVLEKEKAKKAKAKKISLHAWFDEDDERAKTRGLLPPISSLRLSDDSRETIRLQKQRQAKLREEEQERKRMAELERKAEEARQIRADIMAKTGGLRMPEEEFIGEITPEWEAQLQHTLRTGPQVIQVLSRTGAELHKNEFQRLLPPTEWLNDEVVNGALEWLDEAVNLAAGVNDPKKATRKCLVMTSLWYKSAKEKGFTGTARALRRQGVTKDNILDVDTILVPICEGNHWTLLVIEPSKRKIAHMDSMNAAGSTRVTDLAKVWMKDILGDVYVDEEWSIVRHEAPAQRNGYDCGVFAITNGMCLALGLSPIYTYRSDQMAQMRKRIGCVLLNQGFKGPFDLSMY